MADAYGTLTFAQSKDCSYDKKGLLAALNALSWDNEGGCWDACDGQAGLVFCRSRVQTPPMHSSTCSSDFWRRPTGIRL